MSTVLSAHNHLLSQSSESFRELTVDEVVPHLVGHTVKAVERGLILHTLVRHHGSRTVSARVLGISIRSMRNKIHEYEGQGIAVTPPGEPSNHPVPH